MDALILIAAFLVYWTPTIVVMCRKNVKHTGSVVVVNTFAGWTFVGWVIALAMACRSAEPPEITSE